MIIIPLCSLCHGSGISETWEFSTALKRLVEIVWVERREGERERVSSSSRSLCSRAGLELIGLLRRTTENTANTLCQVKDPRVYSSHLLVILQSKPFVQCLAGAISSVLYT